MDFKLGRKVVSQAKKWRVIFVRNFKLNTGHPPCSKSRPSVKIEDHPNNNQKTTKRETTLWGQMIPDFPRANMFLQIGYLVTSTTRGKRIYGLEPSFRTGGFMGSGVPKSWRQEAPWCFGSWPIPDAPWDWYIYLHETHKNQPNVGYINNYSIHRAFGCHLDAWKTYGKLVGTWILAGVKFVPRIHQQFARLFRAEIRHLWRVYRYMKKLKCMVN